MAISCAHNQPSQDAQNEAARQQRDILPANVAPTHYDLLIKPDMEKFVFDGVVTIQLDVKENSDVIQLNSKDLTIRSTIVRDNGEELKAESSVDQKKEVLTLKLPRQLARGRKVELIINYAGIINDKMAGFYRSSYEDKSGQKRFMGATQFESTDARQAFPCWDEPAVKSKFSVSLVIPEELTGLSNMDEASVEQTNGLKTIRFKESPVMSTYLVAWVIGDLESIETVNKHGVKVRVYAVRGDVEQGRFALDVAARTLDFFTEYFDLPYPLPKMDMVAIPDFSAGAMENWGLVTYRTAYLLFDEANSSLKTKQNVAYVVGHELAHQWFGNLVTMEWWSDLWLNEGFATWVGWLAADHLFPEWDIWTEFVVDDCQAGLRLDGLRSSHPIEVPVKNPAEISQIFDSISYSKGASVIRMLVTYLGEDTFKRGLRSYLRTHMYGNARTADLWTSLSEASGQPVNTIMAAWTQRIGFPVIDVKADQQETRLNLHVKQERFLNGGDVQTTEDNTLWSVPLRLGTDKEELVALGAENSLLSKKTGSLIIDGTPAFFKLNMGQAGFYRVNYPNEWLLRLGEAVHQDKLSASDRVGLVSDAFAMSVAGKLPLTSVLSLLSHFNKEQDYLVWGELSAQLAQMLSVWWEEDDQVLSRLKQFCGDLYASQVDRLGFDYPAKGEDDKIKLLRPLVIGMAGKCGHQGVIKEAQNRFARFVQGETSAIHPNLRGTIYSIVIREGAQTEYDQVFKLYRTLTVADQKLAALGALASSRNPAIIEASLQLTKESEVVRPQDAIYILRTAGLNPVGRRLTWAFVQRNWDFFYNRYGLGGGISLLGRIVSTSTQEFSSEADAREVSTFFASKDNTTYERTLQQSLERIRLNAGWFGKHREAVAQWLLTNVRKIAK